MPVGQQSFAWPVMLEKQVPEFCVRPGERDIALREGQQIGLGIVVAGQGREGFVETIQGTAVQVNDQVVECETACNFDPLVGVNSVEI